jgi:hypothetical protein
MNASNMRITVSCAHRGSWELEYEGTGCSTVNESRIRTSIAVRSKSNDLNLS